MRGRGFSQRTLRHGPISLGILSCFDGPEPEKFREVVMMKRAAAVSAVFVAAIGTTAASVQAAEYPERNVELVIPYPAGGGIDLLLRALAEGYSAHFKQPFTVANRTGAGGAIGVA